MNKRGRLELNHLVNLTIGVLIVAIFIWGGIKLYIINADENLLKKADSELNKIRLVIDEVQESGNEKKIIIFPPKGWVLKTFPKSDFPIGECRGAVDCLCICKEANCESEKKCKGFSFEVEVDEGYEIGLPTIPKGAPFLKIPIKNTIKLEELDELKIFKENSVIKIRRNDNE